MPLPVIILSSLKHLFTTLGKAGRIYTKGAGRAVIRRNSLVLNRFQTLPFLPEKINNILLMEYQGREMWKTEENY